MKMKFILPMLLLFGGLALFQACKTQKNPKSSEAVYACPMHPEVTGKKGDTCPKCKMALTKTAAKATCCCPNHPECKGKMGEKCPKCATPMEELRETYACPMHPDHMGKKGDHCPKCKMDMVPKNKSADNKN